MRNILDALGVCELYDYQVAPIEAAREGKDIIVRFPTSFGKSLIGQVPALEDDEGYSVVISPLLALQKDQRDKLAARGLSVFCLNSEMGEKNRKELLVRMSGKMGATLIYMAPEQFVKKDVQAALANGGCHRVIVDEAHLILNATKDYRPEFKQIGKVVDKMPEKPQIIALTATVTPAGIKKIRKALHCPDAELFSLPVRRENLRINMVELSGEDYQGKICQAVLNQLGDAKNIHKTIIYCRTRKDTEDLYKFLKARKYDAVMIHGGTKRKDREKRQTKFADSKVRIMVSTTAFGLGVDILDVRQIIHAGLPLTFDGYIQEIGRAGRDGRTADCCLIYHEGDFGRNEGILSKGKSRAKAKKAVDLMRKAVNSDACIWKIVDKHFKDPKGGPCGVCPACRKKALRRK